jgi:negative regulator of flagellin synthesis FlgM
MKIGNPADKPAPAAVGNGTPAAAVSHAAASAPAPTAGAIPAKADASAKIELSNTAATLLTSGATAEFDAEKVARISKAIDEGTFKINPEAIADKLISNAQELLGKVQA